LSRFTPKNKVDIFAVLSVVIPLFFYLLTLAPSVTFFDSGEFITAIQTLGSPHSPGYPLFVLFAKPFTWLPFGNIAFRVNIATALSAAMACYGVYLLVNFLLADNNTREEGQPPGFIEKSAALGAALIFAFSDRLWLQSNHDKPYPLLAFISAIILYLILLWRRSYRNDDERPGYIHLGAFFCGLAFGAHQSMILLIPSYAWLVLSADWSIIRRIKDLILSCAFFLLGFSIYLYLPIRATRSPLLNWGDPQTLPRFLWHFLRKGYPAEKVNRDLPLLWKQISAFNIAHEFTIVGLFLLLTGLVAYAARKRDVVISYGIAICTFLAILVGYQNTPEEMIFLTEEFFTPLYLFTSVWIGMGCFFLVKQALHGVEPERIRTVPFRLAAVTIFVTLPLTLCALNFHENDQHENYIAFDYANNSFRSLERGAVLFTWGDSGAFPLWYLQGVERMREDLVLLHTPHLVFDWYLDSFPEYFRSSVLRTVPRQYRTADNVLRLAIGEQIDGRPVYIDFSTRYSMKLDDYGLHQRGICYRVNNRADGKTESPNMRIWDLYAMRGIAGDKIPFRDLDTYKAILIYGISHLDAGEALLSLGRRDEGYAELQSAEKLAPELGTRVKQIEMPYGNRKK
jgi:hypothetical protein